MLINLPMLGDTADNGKKFWKQGGTFFRDCIRWSISTTENDAIPG